MEKGKLIKVGGIISIVCGIGAFVLQVLGASTSSNFSTGIYSLKDAGWAIGLVIVGVFLLVYKPKK